MSETSAPRFSWPVYAVLAGLTLLAVFVATRLGADTVMPTLFAAISLGVNCLGHLLIVGFDKMRGSPVKLDLRRVLPVAIAIGLIIASNDVNSVLMFAANAPLSIATPVHGTAVIILSVLFGVLFLHEKTNNTQRAGLLCALAGIVLLNV